MKTQTAIAPAVALLVAFPLEQHLKDLHSKLALVRSDAVAHGQFGSSRMALATRAACETALADSAEIVLGCLMQAIETNEGDLRGELIAEAKNIFMAEFSKCKNKIEATQKENSGSYFQPIPVNDLTGAHLVKISIRCEAMLVKRKAAWKRTIIGCAKWALSAFGYVVKLER